MSSIWKKCGKCGGQSSIYDHNLGMSFTCPACHGSGGKFITTSRKSGNSSKGGKGGNSNNSGCYLLILLLIAGAIFYSKSSAPTDNIRPQGVSEEKFKSDPTIGKLKIERCGNLYKYYDSKYMKRFPGRRLGYTMSTTPPYEEVDYIVESFTVYRKSVYVGGTIVSRDRRIPRSEVTPSGTPVDDDETRKDSCESFYYTPPSSASAYEKQLVNEKLNQWSEISDMLCKLRVTRAKQLLTGTSHPISIISELSGFNDPERMAVVFNRVEEITPSAYR